VHDASGVREVLLEPGLCMYLPAGTPHAARAQDDASLHVTVGINQVTWRQMLTEVVEEALRTEGYDERLPAGYAQAPEDLAAQLARRVETLAETLRTADPRGLVNAHLDRFLSSRTPLLRGGLRDRLAVAQIGDDTKLLRRSTAACHLVPDGATLRVLLGDRELRMPGRLLAAMEVVRDAPALTPRDLSGSLDEASRLVLTRRLVREGLLRIQG
jgi:hypothetical protein